MTRTLRVRLTDLATGRELLTRDVAIPDEFQAYVEPFDYYTPVDAYATTTFAEWARDTIERVVPQLVAEFHARFPHIDMTYTGLTHID